MNWNSKTPEERRAIAAKSVATRRANRDRDIAIRQAAKDRILGLKDQIQGLESRLSELQSIEMMNAVSLSLTNKVLLNSDEIVKASMPWSDATGVYFLISGDKVVYVGQAINVYARISQHQHAKSFDRYAYISCSRELLNRIESLYIHVLRPPLNADINGGKFAPIPLDELIGLSEISKRISGKSKEKIT